MMKLRKKSGVNWYRITAVLWLILFGFISVLKADPVDVKKAKAVALLLEAYISSDVAGNVIHVTPEGAGLQDGSSWENATSDLYGEMMADRTDTMQIWVKEGIYYGDTVVGQGGNLAAFVLGKRNKVYGSFAGNESSLSARVQNNPSILDGQNSRRVLCQLLDFADADSSFIDGFTLRNGLDTIAGTANIERDPSDGQTNQSGSDMTGNGGGVYLRTNGILKNCIIEDCKAKSGGGAFNHGGKIIDCSFNHNEAEHAGGIFNRGTLLLTGCTISDNKATYIFGYGGGVYNMGTLLIADSTLINNNNGFVGKGVYTHSAGSTIMNGGEIFNNTGSGSGMGGGMYNDGIVEINGGVIINNQAGNGAGIANHGNLTVNSGSISYNTGSTGGGIMNGGNLWLNGSSVKIQGNNTGEYGSGGGLFIYRGNAYINGVIIGINTESFPESLEEALASGGNVARIGGGIYLDSNGSLTISNVDSVIVGGNYSTVSGGGIYVRASVTFPSNVFITGNTCDGPGGGINTNLTNPTITLNGCSILNNKSGSDGGGIYSSSYLSIYNNTMIADNSATSRGGAYI
jgi:predicted outer membrane repeat protein